MLPASNPQEFSFTLDEQIVGRNRAREGNSIFWFLWRFALNSRQLPDFSPRRLRVFRATDFGFRKKIRFRKTLASIKPLKVGNSSLSCVSVQKLLKMY